MNIVYVVKSEDKLEKSFLNYSLKYIQVLTLVKIPGWDCLPYDNVSPSARITGERIDSFIKISNNKSIQLIIITINALLQKNVPFNDFPKSVWEIKESTKIILSDFSKSIIDFWL